MSCHVISYSIVLGRIISYYAISYTTLYRITLYYIILHRYRAINMWVYQNHIPYNDARWHIYSWVNLVITCPVRVSGTKPLTKAMLVYSRSAPEEQSPATLVCQKCIGNVIRCGREVRYRYLVQMSIPWYTIYHTENKGRSSKTIICTVFIIVVIVIFIAIVGFVQIVMIGFGNAIKSVMPKPKQHQVFHSEVPHRINTLWVSYDTIISLYLQCVLSWPFVECIIYFCGISWPRSNQYSVNIVRI